jgi:hypothetical protein
VIKAGQQVVNRLDRAPALAPEIHQRRNDDDPMKPGRKRRVALEIANRFVSGMNAS